MIAALASFDQGNGSGVLSTPGDPVISTRVIVRGIDHFLKSPVGQVVEPYFANFGKRIRLNQAVARVVWAELDNGDGSLNRFFAIVLGYLVVGLSVALYLNILNAGSVQNAGRAMRSAIRQQSIVSKVSVL